MSNFWLQLKNLAAYPWWEYTFIGNSVWQYTEALCAFIILLIIFWLFQIIILRRLAKFSKTTSTDLDDTLIKIIRTLRPPFYSFLSLYLAFSFLNLPELVWHLLNAVLIIWLVWQAITAVELLINYVIRRALVTEDEGEARTAIQSASLLSKIVLWTIGILMILSNLGIEITSLIAGLGIGGVAVALALQNILSDLFSSFALYFDKPFKVGDFIIIGTDMGVVERIGIKTTRLRALQGEEIVISNQELTSVRVQNFKKMEARRVVFSFGVTYDTPENKLKQIPELVKDIINGQSNARFDRAHFKSFGDSALLFEVVYYIATGDYNLYMDVQQNINLNLKSVLADLQVEFAYPTQTIYLSK